MFFPETTLPPFDKANRSFFLHMDLDATRICGGLLHRHLKMNIKSCFSIMWAAENRKPAHIIMNDIPHCRDVHRTFLMCAMYLIWKTLFL